VDLPTGAVFLGASTLGQPDRPGAAELAEAMLRSGFPAVDTANGYAAGRSEAYLGAAIGRVGRPEGTEVVTKVDADPVTGVFDGDRVRRSFAESLDRLGLDRVPLLHLHDPYTVTLAEAMAPVGAVPALVRLREEGAVDAIGIAAGPVRLLLDYVETGAFDAVLTHNRFTLVDRSGGPVLRAARARAMLAINAAPFGGGILAGSTRHRDRYAYRPVSPEILHRVGAARLACSRHGVPMDAAALAFSTRSPLVDATVVGISSAMRLRRLHELVDTDVPDELLDELTALTDDDR
jgi:D-threo-aldose 1-dehydrogenase